jgi:hypothetical protein
MDEHEVEEPHQSDDEFWLHLLRDPVKRGYAAEGDFSVPYYIFNPAGIRDTDGHPLHPLCSGYLEAHNALFISNQIPRWARKHVIRHELRCCVLRRGLHGRCADTTLEDLKAVSRFHRRRFIEIRLAFFEDLLARKRDPDLIRELLVAIEVLKSWKK